MQMALVFESLIQNCFATCTHNSAPDENISDRLKEESAPNENNSGHASVHKST